MQEQNKTALKGEYARSFTLTKKTHITIVVSDAKGHRACDKGDEKEEYATAAAREKSHVLEGFFGEASRKVALEPERRRVMLQQKRTAAAVSVHA